MKVVSDGYDQVHFEQNHLATMLAKNYGLNNIYLASENVEEFKAVLKISRLLGHSTYLMVRNEEVGYEFKWEKIG